MSIIPRVAGVSGNRDTRPILFSLRPISVRRWSPLRRIGLPVC
jgi:hypothetical protein